jgi:hypothetical protein
MLVSDDSDPCITGDELRSSRCGPPGHGMVSPESSRFPCKERARMLGVSDRAEPEAHSRLRAPRCCLPLAHRRRRSGLTVFAAQCPAYVSPYRLLVGPLAETSARLGAGVVRYTFPGMDLHHMLLTGLPANLGDVSHGTGTCPSPVFPRVHPDPNTSAVRSPGYCSRMIMRLRGSVGTRGVLQLLAPSNAMYPAWFLRGRGWRTSSAPLPPWQRHPMPGGGVPVVRELPSSTVNKGEGRMGRGGGRTCSPG